MGSAAEFSWDLAGLASEGHHGGSEADHSSLRATHYFGGVDDSSGPYALAPFLDPASHVSVAVGHSRFVEREDDKSVSGRHVLPRSRWYFGGSYTRTDIDSPPGSSTNFVDRKAYGFSGGKFLSPTTSLEAAFDSSETRGQAPYIVCIGSTGCLLVGTIESRIQQDHASIDLLHVGNLGTLRYSLSGRIATTNGHLDVHTPAFALPILVPPFGTTAVPASSLTFDIPRLRNYSVAGELFPTSRLGIRVGYTRWDDGTPAEDAYDVAATWFFTHNVGVRFAFSRQQAGTGGIVYTDVNFQNMDVGTLAVIGRF